MWASVMSTKTSSTCSNNTSIVEDLEKTPPREDFVEDIVRTPTRSVVGKPSLDPVSTPTKILEVESQIKLVDMSDGNVEGEFIETQEIPEIPVENEMEKEKKTEKETAKEKEKEMEICKKVKDIQQIETEAQQGINEDLENQSDDSDKTAEETDPNKEFGATESNIQNKTGKSDDLCLTTETNSKHEQAAMIIEDADEDAETDCELDEPSKAGNLEQLDEDDADELQITSVQDPCSLVITHVQESPSVGEARDSLGQVAVSDNIPAPVTDDFPVTDSKVDDNSPPSPQAEVWILPTLRYHLILH